MVNTFESADFVRVSGNGAVVFGRGTPGHTVSVTSADDTVLGEGMVRSDGAFAVRLQVPQSDGETLGVSIIDQDGAELAVGSVEAPDFTRPAPVEALEISPEGDFVTGHGAVANEEVRITSVGTPIGSAFADPKGHFKVQLSEPHINAQKLDVFSFDTSGNRSLASSIDAPDKIAPSIEAARASGDGLLMHGQTEPFAAISIAQCGPSATIDEGTCWTVAGTADAEGRFIIDLAESGFTNNENIVVTAADEHGNVSAPSFVNAPDLHEPLPASEIEFSQGNSISGKGEPGASVVIANTAGEVLAQGVVSADGAFEATLARTLESGETVEIILGDAAGNLSFADAIYTASEALVPEEIDPAAPAEIPSVNPSDVISGLVLEAEPVAQEPEDEAVDIERAEAEPAATLGEGAAAEESDAVVALAGVAGPTTEESTEPATQLSQSVHVADVEEGPEAEAEAQPGGEDAENRATEPSAADHVDPDATLESEAGLSDDHDATEGLIQLLTEAVPIDTSVTSSVPAVGKEFVLPTGDLVMEPDLLGQETAEPTEAEDRSDREIREISDQGDPGEVSGVLNLDCVTLDSSRLLEDIPLDGDDVYIYQADYPQFEASVPALYAENHLPELHDDFVIFYV